MTLEKEPLCYEAHFPTVGELPEEEEEVHMAPIIVIGNPFSFAIESYMVAPRGYSPGGLEGRTLGKED